MTAAQTCSVAKRDNRLFDNKLRRFRSLSQGFISHVWDVARASQSIESLHSIVFVQSPVHRPSLKPMSIPHFKNLGKFGPRLNLLLLILYVLFLLRHKARLVF